jgi:hypothetical protein
MDSRSLSMWFKMYGGEYTIRRAYSQESTLHQLRSISSRWQTGRTGVFRNPFIPGAFETGRLIEMKARGNPSGPEATKASPRGRIYGSNCAHRPLPIKERDACKSEESIYGMSGMRSSIGPRSAVRRRSHVICTPSSLTRCVYGTPTRSIGGSAGSRCCSVTFCDRDADGTAPDRFVSGDAVPVT